MIKMSFNKSQILIGATSLLTFITIGGVLVSLKPPARAAFVPVSSYINSPSLESSDQTSVSEQIIIASSQASVSSIAAAVVPPVVLNEDTVAINNGTSTEIVKIIKKDNTSPIKLVVQPIVAPISTSISSIPSSSSIITSQIPTSAFGSSESSTSTVTSGSSSTVSIASASSSVSTSSITVSNSSSLSLVSSIAAVPDIIYLKDCPNQYAKTVAALALTKGALLQKEPAVSCTGVRTLIWLQSLSISLSHYSANFFLPGSDYLDNGGLLEIKIFTKLESELIGEISGAADHDQIWLSEAQANYGTAEHELFHVADFKIYGEYSPFEPDAEWMKLNAAGFAYNNYKLEWSETPGFAEAYGKASWSEDRATIYEGYRDGTLTVVRLNADAILKAKWEYIKAQLIKLGVTI
jgi:hypothetical protein